LYKQKSINSDHNDRINDLVTRGKYYIMSKKKVLQAVATIGAVTATGAIATTAHADTTPATSNAAVSQTPSADQQLSSLQASQAKAEQSLTDQNQAALNSQTATIEQQASEAANKENAAYSSAVASQSAANQKELANAAQHIVTPAQKAQQESAAKSAYDKSNADLDAQHSAKSNQIKTDYDAAVKKTTDEVKAN
jgi:alanyl-tRNA synthetase